MGRWRTVSVDVEVGVSDFMEELEDEELIEELKRRKCDTRFMDFSFPELDDSTFRDRVVEMIYQSNTERVQMMLDAIVESYHYVFLKEPQ